MKHALIFLSICTSFFSNAQSFKEEPVEIGELKGTLITPEQETSKAILMISGSGPTDRNGNSALGLNNNSLKMVAHALGNAGYAVLRFDKRGIAESKNAITNPTDMRFDDFVSDAKNWLSLLEDSGYSDLVIAGHSQGSLVGILAAQDNKNVTGFISISGLSEDAGEAIIRQLGMQSPALAEDARVNIDSMKNGHTVNSYSPYLASLFGPHIQDFLKSYILYNPSNEVKKLDIPVLIVNGTTDMQVGKDQAENLKVAYPDAKLLIIPGMNHVLKDTPENDLTANMATYNNPDLSLSDGLMTGIIEFLQTL
ncbi:alpha/beta hydrolase [Ekhidna sp.]